MHLRVGLYRYPGERKAGFSREIDQFAIPRVMISRLREPYELPRIGTIEAVGGLPGRG
jgi:hypothetical protein